MAYLQLNTWRDRPGAVAAVIAIHGIIGYALVTGLEATQIISLDPPLIGEQIEEIPLTPPPPPKPDEKADTDPAIINHPINVPLPPVPLATDPSQIETTARIFPPLDPIVRETPGPTPGPRVAPSPKFSPVSARPRNNPGAWVTTADYRSSWINREMVGTARFRLEVTADGKAQSCAITVSSGYSELDRATCDLVTRRARFDAAKDETGARTNGSYASSVRWELPE